MESRSFKVTLPQMNMKIMLLVVGMAAYLCNPAILEANTGES